MFVVTVMLPLPESSSKRRKLLAGAGAEKWTVLGLVRVGSPTWNASAFRIVNGTALEIVTSDQ